MLALLLYMYIGVEFPFVPETGDVPLVCDISSNFLTERVDVRKVRNQVANSHSLWLLHSLS